MVPRYLIFLTLKSAVAKEAIARFTCSPTVVANGTTMTCYFRALGKVFQKAGIEVTRENRRKIDAVIQHIVGTEGEHCPATWREVKKRLAEDENGFTLKLKEAWNSQS